MLKKVPVIFLFFFALPLSAQEMSDEYERMFGERESFVESVADSLPSLYSGTGISIFEALSRYNFNFISYRKRGYDGRNSSHYLENLDVSPVTDKYPDYSFYAALRISVPYMVEYSSLADCASGGSGSAFYSPDPSRARPGIGLRADYSEEHYRRGGRLSAAGDLGKGWGVALNTRYRGGRDKFIGGVFSESLTASAAVAKDFGRTGKLMLFGMGAASDRGMRNWTVGETFRLTGDNLYNPSWGWFSGKPRNSNLRRDASVLVAASYAFGVGAAHIKLSVMYRRSERSRSRLLWRNALSPMPDHYANLPSYYSDPRKAEELAYIWRNNPDIRQVNWNLLYDVNRRADGGTVYMVGADVSRTNGLQAAVSGNSRFSEVFGIDYGLRFSWEHSDFFRRAEDMLGGGHYSENISSGERTTISEGERFGYDFGIPRHCATAYVSGIIEQGRWVTCFAAELSHASLSRKGANAIRDIMGTGALSASGRAGFTTCDIKLRGEYRFSSSGKLSAAVWAGTMEPSYQDIFLDPQSGNSIVPGISVTPAAGAELRYSRAVSKRVTLELSAYYTRTSGGTDVYRYYDNAVSEYVIMPLSAINKRFAGIEGALKADITERFSITAGASLNEYIYARHATASFYSSAGMELLAENERCQIEGLVCSASPQNMFALSAAYSITYKWSFTATFVYGTGRYVAVNPVRRTARIYGLASSPETVNEFISQERLPAASSVDLSVSRRFRLRGCYVYAGLAVHNLLGNKNMIYGGYEQMRIEAGGSGASRTYSSAPSRYAYCYPRSIFATVSINF